jgi:hypothetical protein
VNDLLARVGTVSLVLPQHRYRNSPRSILSATKNFSTESYIGFRSQDVIFALGKVAECQDCQSTFGRLSMALFLALGDDWAVFNIA